MTKYDLASSSLICDLSPVTIVFVAVEDRTRPCASPTEQFEAIRDTCNAKPRQASSILKLWW